MKFSITFALTTISATSATAQTELDKAMNYVVASADVDKSEIAFQGAANTVLLDTNRLIERDTTDKLEADPPALINKDDGVTPKKGYRGHIAAGSRPEEPAAAKIARLRVASKKFEEKAASSVLVHEINDVESKIALEGRDEEGCLADGVHCGMQGGILSPWNTNGCYADRQREPSCPFGLKSPTCCGNDNCIISDTKYRSWIHDDDHWYCGCLNDGVRCGNDYSEDHCRPHIGFSMPPAWQPEAWLYNEKTEMCCSRKVVDVNYYTEVNHGGDKYYCGCLEEGTVCGHHQKDIYGVIENPDLSFGCVDLKNMCCSGRTRYAPENKASLIPPTNTMSEVRYVLECDK